MPAWIPPPLFTDSGGNALVFNSGTSGFQMPVTPTASVMLNDNFNGTVIDLNRWNAPVLAGTGTMTQGPTGNGNALVTTLGTTANNAASITSVENFEPSTGNLIVGSLLSIEAAPGTNTNRCFGSYTKPGSFTAATPVQDGYVWEFDIAGTFGASVYSGGTRVFRQVVPLNGATLLPVGISYQGLSASFYYSNFQTPIVTVYSQPSTLNLPVGFHAINHTAGPSGAPTWNMPTIVAEDQSGNLPPTFTGQTLSRQRYPAVFKNLNAVSIAAETTIWTPPAGRKFRIMGFVLETGVVGGNVLLKDNTAGSTILNVPFGSASQVIVAPPMGNGILSGAVNNVLTATGTATQTLSGYIFGTEE